MIISTLSLLIWLKRRVEFETQVKQGRVKKSFLIEHTIYPFVYTIFLNIPTCYNCQSFFLLLVSS
ncbi:hypothetical protein NC651_030821 [Populus alba x Populus x berolinensis]|nr:hypothetical protein NC651_030821 [Populus alba x Populus x berolinensis]